MDKSRVLEYNSVLEYNRSSFLVNYSRELNLFEDTDKKLLELGEFISKNRDNHGNSHISLGLFILIIGRQANNVFNMLMNYQSYDAWIIFRPALEALLILGKFLDDPKCCELWKRRKELWLKKEELKDDYKAYCKEFSGRGLIPKSLEHGNEFREILIKVNDEYVHFNFEHYLPQNYEIEKIDERTMFISVSSTDVDFQKHKAYLLSFLHLYRKIVISLEKAIAERFDYKVTAEIESVIGIWKPQVMDLIKERPDLIDIFVELGLWNLG